MGQAVIDADAGLPRAGVDVLCGDLSGLDGAGVIALVKTVEAQRRRLAAVDARLIFELGERAPGATAGGRAVKLLSLVLAAMLVGGLCSCTSRPPARLSNSPGAVAAQAQFLTRAEVLLPGLPDYRLMELAGTTCDQLKTNVDGDDMIEIEVRRAAPTPVTAASANDFMQAAVLWECPRSYDPGDYVHPHKYDH